MRAKKSGSFGFTLIEVMVAIALLAVISILLWQSMGASVQSKERFEKKDQVFREATLSLDRMAQDLSTAMLLSSVEFLGVSENGEQNTKSAFIGENLGDQDKVSFHALSHIRYLKDVKESDQAEISYFLEPQSESSDDSEISTADLFVLKKREQSPPDANPTEGGTIMTLLEGVKEMNLRYFDPVKAEWAEAWDTTSSDYVNRLPRAIEIVLVVQDPVDEDGSLTLTTTSLLEMAPGPNDF